MLGGEAYNEHTLSRFYIIHAAVLPVSLIMMLTVHIALIRLQGVTEFSFKDDAGDKPKHFNFFPDHMLTELMVGLALMILLSTLATILPPEMGPKADPLSTPEVIKPEWFFYATFRWLKLFAGTTAVLSMGLLVFLMIIWTFIDGGIRRVFPKSQASVRIGIVAVAMIIGLTVWEALVEH